jgi:hypothetical protein
MLSDRTPTAEYSSASDLWETCTGRLTVRAGERVLTSPVFDWANVMPEVIQVRECYRTELHIPSAQRGIDGTLGAQSIVFRLAQGAVGVAPVSGTSLSIVVHFLPLNLRPGYSLCTYGSPRHTSDGAGSASRPRR